MEPLRTEIIPNRCDGPKHPEKLPSGHFSPDYASPDDAAEIDAGIREIIRGVRLSILAMGIGLARLKAKGLSIGGAYLKYRKELEKAGFSDEDSPPRNFPMWARAPRRNHYFSGSTGFTLPFS